ncbi:glutamate racemase [Ichthyobacterium seriolicida]|uniref:Glutamate racemase n=1 Tax=Ichthyobacterium seriolicida TaxID=242600 RepID=A0A1J1EA85_9FLAO|nr:glutamate racemase [Ichthyobacterium seriolicida]BAV94843.1 glutamate racemase [Ichthyobacterium seriolicida]
MGNRPIGIFDSGIGGLTVAKVMLDLLPNERFIYFGDTKNLPYGEKSPESIIEYSDRIVNFLIEKNCKAIVIACNSASSIAYSHISSLVKGDNVLVFNVIIPAVKQVLESKFKRVGVIATRATVDSHIYYSSLNSKGIEVRELATPLLAPMIEEGFYKNSVSYSIISEYLSNYKLQGIDSLILGCTHYPLIRDQINKYYNFSVATIDSAEYLSRDLKSDLIAKGIINSSLAECEIEVFVSDYTQYFYKTSQVILGRSVKLEKINL